jgi:hypothetical protein
MGKNVRDSGKRRGDLAYSVVTRQGVADESVDGPHLLKLARARHLHHLKAGLRIRTGIDLNPDPDPSF